MVVKAVATDVSQRTGVATVVARTGCLGRVHHQLQPVARGNVAQRAHVGRLPEDVYRHDGAGARRDQALDTGRVDVVADSVDVGEHRDRVPVQDGGGAGGHGPGRGDDLVARLHADGADAGDQARGPGVDGHRMAHAEVFGGLRLQSAHARAAHEEFSRRADVGGQHAAADDLGGGLHFVLAHAFEKCQGRGDGGRAAVQGKWGGKGGGAHGAWVEKGWEAASRICSHRRCAASALAPVPASGWPAVMAPCRLAAAALIACAYSPGRAWPSDRLR